LTLTGNLRLCPSRVLLGVAENLQFEEQIFYRQHLRCFGKRQWEKILNSALEGPAKAGPSGLGYLLNLNLFEDCLIIRESASVADVTILRLFRNMLILFFFRVLIPLPAALVYKVLPDKIPLGLPGGVSLLL